MSALIATDLDGTLIYSARSLALPHGSSPELVCVETMDAAPASFMTASAAELMTTLAEHATIVAVSVRSPQQLARVRLPGASRYAIAANGGRLYVDGSVDGDWSRRVRDLVADQAPYEAVHAHVTAVERQGWLHRARGVEDLFCYGIVDLATVSRDAVAEEADRAAALGWRVSLQGRKLYWVPCGLDKSVAVAELAEREGVSAVFAAGDSGLDAQMLLSADAAIRPAHGELHRTNWNGPGVAVTRARGVLAGAEIVRWFAERVLGVRASAALAAPAAQEEEHGEDGHGRVVALRRGLG